MVETIDRRQRDVERLAVSVFTWVVLGALLLRYLVDTQSINHDVAMYLGAGQQILHGKWPYTDIVDVNPPLIMYLSVIPAAIARVFGVSAIVACNVTVWALVAGSTLAMRALLRLRSNWTLRAEALVVIAWLAVNVMAADMLEWGQREHLFVLLYVPFLFLRSLDDDERSQVRWPARAAIGGAAALGALLKPGFLVLVAIPEAYSIARRRRRPVRAAETTTFFAAGCAYALHFLLLPSSVRDAFFSRWLPLVSRGYNEVYGTALKNLVQRQWVVFLVMLAVAVFTALRVRGGGLRKPPFDDLFVPLALLSVAALLYYFQQQKGWIYQVLPFEVFAALALAVSLGGAWDQAANSADQKGARRIRLRYTVALILSVAVLLGVREARAATEPDPYSPTVKNLITTYTRPSDRVLIVSTGVTPAYPALAQTDRRPGSRYLWMFPIALFERHRDPARWYLNHDAMGSDERRFVDDVEHDIAKLKPRLVVVESWCQRCPDGFSLGRYLERSGIRATAMSSYARQPDVDGMQVFTTNR